MTIAHRLAVCGVCAVLTACANNAFLPHPRAVMFPESEQASLQAASHWQLIARHEAEQIRQALGDGGGIITPSLYLGMPSDTASPFEQAYHHMLLGALVDQQVAVMLTPENALFSLDYTVQVIEHGDRRHMPPRPGTFTAFLLAGVGIHDSQYWGDRGLVLLPVAAAGDLWARFNRTLSAPATELVVSTRV